MQCKQITNRNCWSEKAAAAAITTTTIRKLPTNCQCCFVFFVCSYQYETCQIPVRKFRMRIYFAISAHFCIWHAIAIVSVSFRVAATSNLQLTTCNFYAALTLSRQFATLFIVLAVKRSISRSRVASSFNGWTILRAHAHTHLYIHICTCSNICSYLFVY